MSSAMNARQLHGHLLRRYDQRGVSGAPWPLLTTRPDDELRADFKLSRSLQDMSEPNTSEYENGRVIAGWISQALMLRQFYRQHPQLAA